MTMQTTISLGLLMASIANRQRCPHVVALAVSDETRFFGS